MGRNEPAVSPIRQAIEVMPDAPVFHYNLGLALWELGRLDEAVSAYRRAVQIKTPIMRWPTITWAAR